MPTNTYPWNKDSVIKGGIFPIPNIATFDHGTNGNSWESKGGPPNATPDKKKGPNKALLRDNGC